MKVNGVPEKLSERVTLEEFLISKGYAPQKVAVELNGRIGPKAEYATTILYEDDVLEIVCFVGGG